jgi:mRNA interferase RelE/StbE
MAEYALAASRSAEKELADLDPMILKRIVPKIESLATLPRPSGCKKLKGEKNRWRLRAGDYRVIYPIDDRARLVDIIAIRHRSEAYE